MTIKQHINQLNKRSNRGLLIKKNIIASFIIKGASVFISFLYVPITLNYLNATRYGIWMTLTSIVAWMSIFDIGLLNGLRNKLAEALSISEKNKARKYVSTSYAILSIIVLIIILCFFIFNNWINWSKILNTDKIYAYEIKYLAFVLVTLFGIKFIFNIINTIFIADQLPFLPNLFEMVGNAFGLLTIWVLTLSKNNSLIMFGSAIMVIPIIINLVVSFIFYSNKYSYLKPSWKYVDFSYARDLLNLGVKFFIIQIATLVLFQTDNVLISHFFSPKEVTSFNISFKYYSIVSMTWGIIMSPMWSAYTNAWSINDYDWLKKTVRKTILGFLAIIFSIFILVIFQETIFKVWLGKGFHSIDFKLTQSIVLFVIITCWNNIFAFFLNGVGKIKLSLIFSIISSVINIPLSFILVKYFNLGVSGIVMGTNISLLVGVLLGPIQTFLILNKKAKGIWNH